MGSCNSAAHTSAEKYDSRVSVRQTRPKKFLQSKKLRSFKENLENKFAHKRRSFHDEDPACVKDNSLDLDDIEVDYDSSIQSYLNTTPAAESTVNTTQHTKTALFDTFPLIDRDSAQNTEPYEIITDLVSMNANSNTATTANILQPQNQTQQLQRPTVTRFGFKPASLQLPASAIPQLKLNQVKKYEFSIVFPMRHLKKYFGHREKRFFKKKREGD